MTSLSFRKLKWWGQVPTAEGSEGAPQDAVGDVVPNADEDYEVRIIARIDESPSFNVEENESRLQRVLEVATNNLLAEKVGGLPAEQRASTSDPRRAARRSLCPARIRRGPLRRSASFGTFKVAPKASKR